MQKVITIGVGVKVGKLETIECVKGNVSDLGSMFFKCRCECGKELVLSAKALFLDKTNKVLSCGCEDNSVDLVGQKFGMYTVLSKAEYYHDGQLQWICQCDCGTIKKLRQSDLVTGYYPYPNCGCYAGKQKLIKEQNSSPIKELTDKELLYGVWQGMKQRCHNPNSAGYENYGGRGIYVCDRWRDSFQNFYDDMYEGYEQGLQIDRIDNDGPYSPENCRWATPAENNRNKRNNRFITTAFGRKTIAEQSEISGVHPRTISRRIKDGIPEEQAILPIHLSRFS